MPLDEFKTGGLIEGINQGIRGAVQGFYDAEERQMRKMESEAKLKAQKKAEARETFMDKVALHGAGLMQDEAGGLIERPLSEREKFAQQMQMRKARAAELAAQQKPGMVMGQYLTPGQKQTDVTFAKEAEDWRKQSPGVARNIGDIDEIINQLGKSDNLTGSVVGKMPDWLKSFVAPESLDVKNRISRIVMQSLRATLGAQFTEKEGEKLIQAAYNENLSEKDNAKRLLAAKKELERAVKAKEEAAEYFRENGTLVGYEPPEFDILKVTPQDLLTAGIETEESLKSQGLIAPNQGLMPRPAEAVGSPEVSKPKFKKKKAKQLFEEFM